MLWSVQPLWACKSSLEVYRNSMDISPLFKYLTPPLSCRKVKVTWIENGAWLLNQHHIAPPQGGSYILIVLYTRNFLVALSLTYTHSVLTAIFPGEPRLAGCHLDSPAPFICLLHIFLDWPKLSMSSLILLHQVFFRQSICLIPSISYVNKRLIQSISSLHSTYLLFLTECMLYYF